MSTNQTRKKKIIKVLCSYNGRMTMKKLAAVMSKDDANKISKIIREDNTMFHLVDGGECQVDLIAKIPLCPDHVNKGGQCPAGSACRFLHICKFFLLSQCPHKSCNYGHSLSEGPNPRVLQEHLMDELTMDDIKVIAKKNRLDLTKPGICRFYNISQGCNKDKCQFLHVCQHFYKDTCKFTRQCKRNHIISDVENKNVLKKYGINIEQSDDAISTELKDILMRSETEGVCCPPPTLMSERTVAKGARPKTSTQVTHAPAEGAGQTEKKTSSKSSKDICLYHLKGKCWHGEKCFRQHKNMIYQWQFSKDAGRTWEDFDETSNESLECGYCNPGRNNLIVQLDGKKFVINIAEPMVGTCAENPQIAIQRLSTQSSECEQIPAYLSKWTTDWKWFWKTPSGNYLEYGNKDPNDETQSSISSRDIEAKYLEDPGATIAFKTEHHTYKLDFGAMTQTNVKISTKRKVKRRPHFYKKEDLKNRLTKQSTKTEKIAVPKEWSTKTFKTQKDLLEHFLQVKLESTTEEYQQIESLFRKTAPGNSICSIRRIENGELWLSYNTRKSQMTAKSARPIKELQLFHGTEGSTIDPICHQGFDFRFSGSRVGAKYGNGSYFARDSKYSLAYSQPDSNGHTRMFVARVLVGEYAKGEKGLVRPPSKGGHELFNSCVDSVVNPSIYVIFSLDQTYPEYLIRFRKRTGMD